MNQINYTVSAQISISILINYLQKVQMEKQLQGKISHGLKCINQKIGMINYENIQPPYIINTLSQLRKIHLNKIIQQSSFSQIKGKRTSEQSYLSHLRYITQNNNHPTYQEYRQQLIKPYMNKLKKSRNQFQALKIQQDKNQEKFIMAKQVDGPLRWVAQWLIQAQITQDLFSQVSLYFGIKTPKLSSTLKRKANQRISNQTWGESIMEKVKNLLSKTLKTSKKIVQSTIFTGIVSSALVLTILVHRNTPIAFEQKLNAKCFAPVGLVSILPIIFQSIYTTIDQSIMQSNMQKWQVTLKTLIQNLRQFNIYLEYIIKNCMKCEDQASFIKQRTNLQKIIINLTKNMDSITQFDEQKLQEMRMRTQAYFKQYKEIKQGQWTLITSRQLPQTDPNLLKQQPNNKQHYQQLKIQRADSHDVLQSSQQLNKIA